MKTNVKIGSLDTYKRTLPVTRRSNQHASHHNHAHDTNSLFFHLPVYFHFFVRCLRNPTRYLVHVVPGLYIYADSITSVARSSTDDSSPTVLANIDTPVPELYF